MIVILGFLIIITSVFGVFLYLRVQKEHIYDNMKINFKNITQVEYGDSNISSKDIVESSKGTIIHYPDIDTGKIGIQKLVYTVEESDVQKEIIHEITIADTKAPAIKLKNKKIEVEYNEEYDLKRNIDEIIDPIDGVLVYSDKEEVNAYWFVSSINYDISDDYTVIVYAKDKHGNKSKEEFIVSVKEEQREIETPLLNENPVETPSTNGNEPYYVNGVLLVNKQHGLPYSYGSGVDASAYAALQQLQNAAASNGHEMTLISGYRSYDYQASLYNGYVMMDGQAAADRYSARPGYSEHQTGLAFDIGKLDQNYGYSPAGQWLAQHAHEYGFIIRYPQGKEHVTGYMYEPWHVRYLGVTLASNVYMSGLTLEEYLGVY